MAETQVKNRGLMSVLFESSAAVIGLFIVTFAVLYAVIEILLWISTK